MSRLVTICVPTRDRLALLRLTLATILDQSHAPMEIVISDNWSSDGTADHCRALAERDERVHYVRPPQPLGLFANHNFALRHAAGEFVCFFHDDDLYQPTIVSRYVTFLEAHPTAGAVCADWTRINANGFVLGVRRHRVPRLSPGREYIERTLPAGRSDLVLSGGMFRRAALPEAPFNESGPLGFTDMVAWFRLAERYDIGHIPETLWSYRAHSGAVSQQRAAVIAADHELAFSAYCDEYLARHPLETATVARWREGIRRFGFWARLYDAIAAISEANGPEPDAATIEALRSMARRPLEVLSVRALAVLVRRRWRWPATLVSKAGPSARRLVGLP